MALQRCERASVVHRAAAEMRETDQRVLSLMMDERAYDYRADQHHQRAADRQPRPDTRPHHPQAAHQPAGR